MQTRKVNELRQQYSFVVAGSLNVPTAELFKAFQDVIVPERLAVHCRMLSRRM